LIELDRKNDPHPIPKKINRLPRAAVLIELQ